MWPLWFRTKKEPTIQAWQWFTYLQWEERVRRPYTVCRVLPVLSIGVRQKSQKTNWNGMSRGYVAGLYDSFQLLWRFKQNSQVIIFVCVPGTYGSVVHRYNSTFLLMINTTILSMIKQANIIKLSLENGINSKRKRKTKI